jgi:hypothetical protein
VRPAATARRDVTQALDGQERYVRWARRVTAVIEAPRDPTTLAAWARHVAAGARTLQRCCRVVHIPAKRSLDFARMLRAVCLSQRAGIPVLELLSACDERTCHRLIRTGGLDTEWDHCTLEQFFLRQRFLQDLRALAAVRRELDQCLHGEGRIRPCTSSIRRKARSE